MLTVDDSCTSLTEFLKCFTLPVRLLQTAQGITEAVRLLQETLLEQGLIYLEIRFAPVFFTKGKLSQKEAVCAALEGLKKSELHTNLILCCMRGEGEEVHKQNFETIRIASEFLVKDGGVVAVDLAGAEALFDTGNFKAEFELASKLKLPFTIHAGEASGAESVKKALDFGALRIGHGVRSYEEPSLLERIASAGIPLEMCPTSNRKTCALKDMKDYPLKKFLSMNIKATVNTDDMAICGTTLRDEFDYLEKEFGLSEAEERTLLLNSVDAAFTDQKTKLYLAEKIKTALP